MANISYSADGSGGKPKPSGNKQTVVYVSPKSKPTSSSGPKVYGGSSSSSKSSSSGGYSSGAAPHNLPIKTGSSGGGGGGGGSSGGGGGGGGGGGPAPPPPPRVWEGANDKVLAFDDRPSVTYGVAAPTYHSSGLPAEAAAAKTLAGEAGAYNPVAAYSGPAGTAAGASTWFDQMPAKPAALMPSHPGFGAQRLGPVASFTPGRGFVRR